MSKQSPQFAEANWLGTQNKAVANFEKAQYCKQNTSFEQFV